MVRADGVVVGNQSCAVLQLDDLVVAICGSVESARNGGISCSIDPTAEGRQRLQQLLKNVKLQPGQNPAALEPAMREAFGPQQITLTGVPTTSRYGRTLIAADFEMKRVAMSWIESPVAGLPSYLEMSKNAAHSSNENPRGGWLATTTH